MKTEIDPLRSHRRKFAAAEAKLFQARDAMREAAKLAGIDTAGLFADGDFILRTTGERWARERGRAASDRAYGEMPTIIRILREQRESKSNATVSPQAAPAADAPEVMPKPRLVVDNQPAVTERGDGAA
jgi:hypothetical protein